MNTLRDLLRAQDLISTDVQEKTVTVGTTPVKVLDNNPNRVSYILGNTGTVTLYFAGSATPLNNSNGVPVGGGNSLASNWHDDMDAVGYEVWAVAASSSVSVFVREVVGVYETQKGQ